MDAAGKNRRRQVSAALLMTLLLSAGLVRLSAVDDMDGDMCSGEMMWMIGWCLDGITGDQPAALLAPVGGTTYAGAFEPIAVPGATATRAFGINARGDIVGSYTDATGTHGYVKSDDVITIIDYPGASSTEAWGINPRGDVIGRYTIAKVPGVRGFLYSHGIYTDISMRRPDQSYHVITLPTKIGASGEIVGCFHDASPQVDMFGFVLRGSSVTVFAQPTAAAPNGSSAMHNGIVPGGDLVVGFTAPTPGTSRGYILTPDSKTFVDFPGSTNTQLWDVNPTGTMVGQYLGNGRTNGFYADADGYHTLNVPASTMTVARGINPQGDIVGVYNDASGAHGFLLRR